MSMKTKVLVVDDIEANLRAMSKTLEELENVETVLAASGFEALDLLLEHEFALILMDVNMPEMSGYETAELITQSDTQKATPIVMVTAQGAESKEVLKAYEAGAVDYLVKPIIPLVMLNKVRQFVALYESRQRTHTINAEREAILDAAGEGVIKVDLNGTIEYCNSRASALLNATKEQIVTTKFGHWFVRSDQEEDEFESSKQSEDLFKEIFSRAQSQQGAQQQQGIDVCPLEMAPFPSELTVTVSYEPSPCLILLFHDISERLKFEIELKKLANYDSLTGLSNRLHFNRKLDLVISQCHREHIACALLLLDLDKFKQINDTLGHDTGDATLKVVANRLVDSIGSGSIAARLGGDEFAILMPNLSLDNCEREATEAAVRIIEEVAKPMQPNQFQLTIETSIGIACCPQGASDVTTLMKAADIALYEAKAAGRNTYQVFIQEMAINTENRASMENKLKKAVESGEVRMCYQPIVCIENKKVIGFEALMRWRCKSMSEDVAPENFISIAEQSNLINELGDFAINQSFLQAKKWQQSYPENPLKIFINLSAKQLNRASIVVDIYQALSRHGIKASCIGFEITETALVKNAEKTNFVLDLLRSFGFHLSLDDFGTGYSSLSHLQRFQVDTIKIDKSFVADLPRSEKSHVLVKAIMLVAQSFKVKTVAEGVETSQQLATLIQLGCLLIQGFVFSRAMSPEEIEQGGMLRPDSEQVKTRLEKLGVK